MKRDEFKELKEDLVFSTHKIKCKLSLIERVIADVLATYELDEHESNRISGAYHLMEDVIVQLEKLSSDIGQITCPVEPSEQAA